jgi:thiamine biosynthesis protein ThiI
MSDKKKVIVVRFGELFLKGKNRFFFVEKLKDNIKTALEKNEFVDFRISKFSDRLIINFKNLERLDLIEKILKKIFGISVFYVANIIDTKEEEICKFVDNIEEEMFLGVLSFKFAVKRNYKKFPLNSMELQKSLGSLIVNKYNLKVDLKSPQKTFNISIYKDFTLFFHEKIYGLGGLPVGSSGKCLLLMSGGIDSPVAAFELMKRGIEVSYIHFFQQTKGLEKITEIVEKLEVYNNYLKNIFFINSNPFFSEIRHIDRGQEKYKIIILKRMFIRLSCIIAEKNDILCIATGDALGQVASQTIESLDVISSVSSKLIICPLITYNKIDIINKSQNIGLYESSLLSYEDCCSLFLPKHPIIKPKKEDVEKIEKGIF